MDSQQTIITIFMMHLQLVQVDIMVIRVLRLLCLIHQEATEEKTWYGPPPLSIPIRRGHLVVLPFSYHCVPLCLSKMSFMQFPAHGSSNPPFLFPGLQPKHTFALVITNLTRGTSKTHFFCLGNHETKSNFITSSNHIRC